LKKIFLNNKRLYFIDAVRAFAILMMLQGHFTDTLLDINYRDQTNLAFNLWQYFRGITAPTFFTISGLIFTFLLIKSSDSKTTNIRIKKGVKRGFMLIVIGYLLRFPFTRLFTQNIGTYFMVIDVLQCIGLSLLLIVFIFKITNHKVKYLSVVMLMTGTLIFIFEPCYRNYSASNFPLLIANYLTEVNGSVFTIIPWFGYMAYGAFIASIFYNYLKHPKFKKMIILYFILAGMFLVISSTWLLNYIFNLTNIELFYEVANYNYLFIRLGNVLVIFGLFYAFERFLKYPLVSKIGQKTLSIYIIHFIILYGSFTGYGLNRMIGKELNPKEVIFGAILFLLIVSYISINVVNLKVYLNRKLMTLLNKIKLFIDQISN
jgi:uncharacterized membrane protein